MSKGGGIFDGVVEIQFAEILQYPLKRAVSVKGSSLIDLFIMIS